MELDPEARRLNLIGNWREDRRYRIATLPEEEYQAWQRDCNARYDTLVYAGKMPFLALPIKSKEMREGLMAGMGEEMAAVAMVRGEIVRTGGLPTPLVRYRNGLLVAETNVAVGETEAAQIPEEALEEARG